MALKTVPFNVAFTFSRPDPADYEDVNGDTQTAGADVPRFNYSEGVGEGLMLDASLSEIAAINDIPNFNSSSGTWVIKADLDKSIPIPGSGFGEFMEGSGTLVFVYSNGVGKCWADGQVLFTVDPFTSAEPGFLSNGGLAKIQDLTYYPYAWTDEDAAAKSSGQFSIYFGPEVFFADGTDGVFFDSTDSGTLFQDTGGSTPAEPGDPCGLRIDKSGNANHQYQTTTAAKPTVQIVDGVLVLALDGTDDDMRIDVPTGGWSGTFVQGTALGVIVGEIDVPEGPYQAPTDPSYPGPASDIHTVIANRTLAENEVDRLVEWVGQRCPARGFEGIDVSDYFRLRSDITNLDCSRWSGCGDASRFALGATNIVTAVVGPVFSSSTLQAGLFMQETTSLQSIDFSGANSSNVVTWTRFLFGTGLTACYLGDLSFDSGASLDFFLFDSPNLESIDVSDNSFPAASTFARFADGCSNLTTLIIYGGSGSHFSASPCTDYTSAFRGTNLSQQSYTDLVTAIEAAGTNGGTLDITGGSATTTGAAQTAVDALRGRGWTVTTPDGY